jgi:sorbitol-specific phosphotransferase system component IIBC
LLAIPTKESVKLFEVMVTDNVVAYFGTLIAPPVGPVASTLTGVVVALVVAFPALSVPTATTR